MPGPPMKATPAGGRGENVQRGGASAHAWGRRRRRPGPRRSGPAGLVRRAVRAPGSPSRRARATREAAPCTGRGRRRRSSRCAASRRSRRGSSAPFAYSSAGPRQTAAGPVRERHPGRTSPVRCEPGGPCRPGDGRRRVLRPARPGAGPLPAPPPEPAVQASTRASGKPPPVLAARSGTARTGRRSHRRDT